VLDYDPSGKLEEWWLAGGPFDGYIVSPAAQVVDDFLITGGIHFFGRGGIGYPNRGVEGAFGGRLEWSGGDTAAPVPEPGRCCCSRQGSGPCCGG